MRALARLDAALGPAAIIHAREPSPEDAGGPDLTAWALAIGFPAALTACAVVLTYCLFVNGWL